MAPKVIVTGRHTWLPDHVVLSNAYGDSIATHMTATTIMAMKRIPSTCRCRAGGVGSCYPTSSASRGRACSRAGRLRMPSTAS